MSVVWHQHQMLTLRKVFLIISSLLVVMPLLLFWAWPHRSTESFPSAAFTVFAIGLLIAVLTALRLGLIVVRPIREMIAVVRRMQGPPLRRVSPPQRKMRVMPLESRWHPTSRNR